MSGINISGTTICVPLRTAISAALVMGFGVGVHVLVLNWLVSNETVAGSATSISWLQPWAPTLLYLCAATLVWTQPGVPWRGLKPGIQAGMKRPLDGIHMQLLENAMEVITPEFGEAGDLAAVDMLDDITELLTQSEQGDGALVVDEDAPRGRGWQ